MPGLTALASGRGLLARRSILPSASSPATFNVVVNNGLLGARPIATSPTSKTEWEPQLARLVDRLPILDNRRVNNNTHLIAQAQRLRTGIEKLEAKAAELKHEALRSEAEVQAILTENQRMRYLAELRDEKHKASASHDKKNEQDGLGEEVKDGQTVDLTKSLLLLALQGVVSETTAIHAMLHEAVQGFGKILDIDIQPPKVCKLFHHHS